MKPYSDDLRERVFEDLKEGQLAVVEIAKRYQVSQSWVRFLRLRHQRTGSIKALPAKGGPESKISPEVLSLIEKVLKERPDCTLQELKEEVSVGSVTTLWRAVKKLGYTLKKSSFRQRTAERKGKRTKRGVAKAELAHEKSLFY